MVEIVLGADAAVYFQEPFGDVRIGGLWRVELDDGKQLIRVLVESDQAEKLLDLCSQRYGDLPEFRCIVLEVGAILPRPREAPADAGEVEEPEPAPLRGKRISREELYAEIEGPVRITANYLALVAFSTIVAAIGLMRDSVAVIIGAMVIAPMLGPNMALSLATLLTDGPLARQAVKSILIGIVEALTLALLLGLVLEVDDNSAELIARTRVGLGDVVLALCAGAAGALSFTSGISSGLVGVMVAVALLPPLTACGLFGALGDWPQAAGTALLFLINLVSINLSGVIVFRLQGIRPGDEKQTKKAIMSTVFALTFWTVLLALLIWIMLAYRDFSL